MSSRTFICWPCRTSYRADVYTQRDLRRCAECGEPISFVSEKVRIPKKDDDRGWEELRGRRRSAAADRLEDLKRLRRELMDRAAELRSRPRNKERDAEIARLEDRIASIDAAS